ncbi:hypothetical protein QWY85_14245 [Neolewinella lacunae]|uniref:Uncharacterized protein n=1 Tax=Neolewinella lacunae TaxID=1517758 RepID=A0A923PKF5_9BACT|nr:hypothetical protein [Neolewinella lacunae]MBC6994326.1 hypothetical protein [Neolewinella lacunae]MDN3635827.1 hypothetical protein [Neolewinella lacunae]
MPRAFFLLIFLTTAMHLGAQLPKTQVYVFDIAERDTTVTFSKPQYLTAFNQQGYNNQPSWQDRNVLLMSVQLPEMEQPDLFSFDLTTKSRTRMTRTRSGEYSPKPIGDGRKFSAIRQEYAGRDTVLRLWEFPTTLGDNGRPVFKYVNGIGYYEWLNSAQVALFLVGNPSTLAIGSVDSDNLRTLAQNVGRCFKRLPNGNLAYVSKATPSWTLVEQNLYRLNEPPRIITSCIQGSEDFAVLRDGSYLMAGGSKIYRFDPIRNPRWKEVVDLRFYGIRNITRIEANGFGKVAIVAGA